MSIRPVADGMLSYVKAKPSISDIRSQISQTRKMVSRKSGGITPTMTDTPTVYGQYKTRMNQFVAPDVSLGLDGQTMAYIKPDAAKARAIFSSKYVPFSDGTELLTGATKKTMSQRGYGNVPASSLETISKVARIGFNNTLADTSGGKISFSMAKPLDMKGIMAHPNNPVCSDFPRGAGVGGSAPLWEDGTYRDVVSAIHKLQDTPPMTYTPLMKDPRKEIFDAQALVGGQVFGNELLKETIEEEFAREKDEEIRRSARIARPRASEEELGRLVEVLRFERRATKIEKQLGLPAGSPIAKGAAQAEIQSEEIAKDEKASLAANLARQAEERTAANKESERRYRVRGGIRQRLPKVAGAVKFVVGTEQGLSATRKNRERIASNLDRKIAEAEQRLREGEITVTKSGKLVKRARKEARLATEALSTKVKERTEPGGIAVRELLEKRRPYRRRVDDDLGAAIAYAVRGDKGEGSDLKDFFEE